MSGATKKRPIFPLPWWAAWFGATVATFAYILLLRYDWPGHPVIAVLAVYFAVLSLLSKVAAAGMTANRVEAVFFWLGMFAAIVALAGIAAGTFCVFACHAALHPLFWLTGCAAVIFAVASWVSRLAMHRVLETIPRH
jgi:hypothetical protein